MLGPEGARGGAPSSGGRNVRLRCARLPTSDAGKPGRLAGQAVPDQVQGLPSNRLVGGRVGGEHELQPDAPELAHEDDGHRERVDVGSNGLFFNALGDDIGEHRPKPVVPFEGDLTKAGLDATASTHMSRKACPAGSRLTTESK